MTDDNLVTLGRYDNLMDARQAAQKLKQAGIPAFLDGEAQALASPSARHDLSIAVAEQDVEHAQLVLDAAPRNVLPSLEPDPTDGTVTLEVYFDPLEAEHAARLLKAHGIPCSVHGTSGSILPGLSPGIPTLRLDVRAVDLDRACEILGYAVETTAADNLADVDQEQPSTHVYAAAVPSLKRTPVDVAQPPRQPLTLDRTEPPPIKPAPPPPDDLERFWWLANKILIGVFLWALARLLFRD